LLYVVIRQADYILHLGLIYQHTWKKEEQNYKSKVWGGEERYWILVHVTDSKFMEAIEEQDRQCTYNVTIRRVRVTIIAVENNVYLLFWVCFCIIVNVARKAHEPYYIVICGLYGCSIYFHIITWRHDSFFLGGGMGKLLKIKCVFWFSLQQCHSKKNSSRYKKNCAYIFV